MAAKDKLAGLGDFGLSAPSDSSGLGDQAPTLDELLGNSILDEANKSKLLEQEIQRRQDEPLPGLLDKLKDPRVAAPLLGALITAIVGKGDAKLAGLGLGAGAVGNLTELGAMQASQKAAGIEELEDKLEKSQDRLDKTRTRLSTIFNTNPESFISPTGETPDARVLGWYMTGTDIPLFPQTRLANDRRDVQWTRRFDTLTKALESAKSKDQARGIVTEIARTLEWGASPSTIDSIVGAMGTPEFEKELAATLLREGGPSALDAMIFAGENGLPLHDPKVLRMIRFQPDTATEPSQQLNQRFINLMDEVNNWQANPANAARILQLQQEVGADTEKATNGIIDAALEGRNADIAFFKDKANLPSNRSLIEMLQAYGLIASKERIVDTLEGVSNISTLKNMSPDERAARRANLALKHIDQVEDTAANRQGARDAVLRNKIVSMLQLELTLPLGQAYQLTDDVINAALEDTPREPDGTVNRDKFEALVKQYAEQAVLDNMVEEEQEEE